MAEENESVVGKGANAGLTREDIENTTITQMVWDRYFDRDEKLLVRHYFDKSTFINATLAQVRAGVDGAVANPPEGLFDPEDRSAEELKSIVPLVEAKLNEYWDAKEEASRTRGARMKATIAARKASLIQLGDEPTPAPRKRVAKKSAAKS